MTEVVGTRLVTLRIPKERCQTEWWQGMDEAHLATCLELIGEMLAMNSATVGAMNDEARVQQLMNKLEGATEASQAAARVAGEQLEQVYRQRLEEKDHVVRTLHQQCDTLRVALEQTRTIYDAHQKSAEQVARMLEQQRPCTAQVMGTVAEAEVEQLIVDTLVCETEDTSHTSGAGDRLVTTPEGMSMMLEVKNVERLHSKHDIEKFKRDVHAGIESERINAALLVSLRTTAIPNVGPGACHIEFVTNRKARVPVVMLASNSRSTIQLAVHAVHRLQQLAHKEFTARGGEAVPEQLEQFQSEREMMQETLPMVLRHVIERDALIDSRIESLQRLLDEAQVERTRQKEVLYHITKMQSALPWLACSDDANKCDLAVDIVLKWFARKNEFPKTSEMTTSQRTMIKQAGGLKTVIDAARKRQRTTAERVDGEGE
jgi:hypothetical protein